jgi:hypothetical protein
MSSGTDLTGRQFGTLTVLMETLRQDVYLCKCSCGKVIRLFRRQLTSEVVRHCGCKNGRPGRAVSRHMRHYVGKDGKTHQHATGEFLSYCAMIGRCFHENNISFENYGGRGITVCARWLEPERQGFRNFLADLGPRPVGMTLDRINVQGHYEPSNCRWATPEVQANNKRQGDEPPVRDIAEVEDEILCA